MAIATFARACQSASRSVNRSPHAHYHSERKGASMAHQEKSRMVTCVFRDRYDAERAFDYLHAQGYADSDINVLMSDKTRTTHYPMSKEPEDAHAAGTLATEGMGVGG